jgi:hypothetical protein
MRRSDAAYVALTCGFVTVLVLTNIVGTKLFLLLRQRNRRGVTSEQ